MGASAVQLAGTVAGFALTGSPIGAAFGGMIGGLVGQELFPAPPIQGPRLETFRATGSAVGAPIVRAYGNNKLAGELIWFGRVRERKRTKKVGGIGGFGGQKVESYEYYATFAVGLQEGEAQCLRSIRINGRDWWQDPGYANGNTAYLDQQARLLEFGPSALSAAELAEYNATALKVAASQGRSEYFTFYRGTSDQPVDPTIQAYLGDHATAYRDTCYVVFHELPVTEYGGGLPLIEFEVVSGPTQSAQTVQFWLSQVMHPWLSGADPRNPLNAHQYKYIKQAVATDSGPVAPQWRDSLSAALADFEADTGFSAALPSKLMGWSVRSASEQYSWEMRPYGGDDMEDRQVLNLHFNDLEPSNGFYQELTAGGADDTQADCRAVDSVLNVDTGNTVWWGDRTEFDTVDSDGGGMIGIYYLSTSADSGQISPRGRNNNNCPTLSPSTCRLKCIPDVIIQVRRVVQCPPPICEDEAPLPENADYCVIDANIYPETSFAPTTSGTFLQLAPYETETVSGITRITHLPVGPVINLDYAPHVARNTAEWWEPFYNAAVLAGLVEGGWTFDETGEGGPGTYPRLVDTACQGIVETPAYCAAQPVAVADVIEAECVKRGLTLADIDTSQITDTMWCYAIPRNISGREAIEQLRTFSWLDAPLVDGVVKFVPRGLNAVATLATDDLGAHLAGNERPPMLEVTRLDDIQLPREVRVGYVDQDNDYQPGQQYYRRLVTDAVNVQQIDLAIGMTSDRAMKVATIALFDQWAARKSLETALGLKWLKLTTADCVMIPDGDTWVRARIEVDDLALPGLRKVSFLRDDQTIYGREASGPTPQIPDTEPPIAQGPTTLVILDIPSTGPTDDDAGYSIAMYGVFDSWESAELFRSLDGGTTYESVLDAGAATAGVVEAPFDGGEMTVRVYGGELLSTTPEAAAAGTNRFATGVNGRWVIGTFETATPLGSGRYTLTDINYGLFDTEWAIVTGSPPTFGEAGDHFVMLESVSRVSEEDDVVGTTVLFKAVTSGTAFDNAPEQTLIARGNGRGFVASFGANTPPAHSDGATHVAGTASTDEWAGFANYLVHDVEGAWIFEEPQDQRRVRTISGAVYAYVAGSPGSWVQIPSDVETGQSIEDVQEQVDDLAGQVGAIPTSTLVTSTSTIGDNKLVRGDGGTRGAQQTGINVSDSDEIDGYKGNVKRVTANSYTLLVGDSGKIIELEDATGVALDMPNNLGKGWNATVVQIGAGPITFTPASGATRSNRQAHTKSAGTSALCVLYVSANSDGSSAVYMLGGDTQA